MDINSNLDTINDSNYQTYVINVIEETFANFIEIDRLFFDNITKPISFRSLIGVSKNDEELQAISQYLNIVLQENFQNLQLTVKSYDFENDPDANVLNLIMTLNCGLLGIPSTLRFKVDLTTKVGV